MTAWGIYFETPVPFSTGVRIQEYLLKKRAEDQIPDTVLFLEHRPVVTLGTRGRTNYLQLPPEELEKRGIEFVTASRGGDVTFHGPGQLVLYPIIKLGEQEADAHGYLYNLEEIAIRTAAEFGVTAFRREGMSGAWTGQGKIAAIGFRLKHWVTMHGMSFNVDLDLEGFNTIVPCGLEGEPVSSLLEILGDNCPGIADVRNRMSHWFSEIMGRELTLFSTQHELPEKIRDIIETNT